MAISSEQLSVLSMSAGVKDVSVVRALRNLEDAIRRLIDKAKDLEIRVGKLEHP